MIRYNPLWASVALLVSNCVLEDEYAVQTGKIECGAKAQSVKGLPCKTLSFIPRTHLKCVKHGDTYFYSQYQGRGDNQITGALRPASLAYLVSFSLA